MSSNRNAVAASDSRHVPAPSPLPSTTLTALVAVLTWVVLELVRSSGPLIDFAFAEAKVLGAAGSALVTYLVPGVVVGVLLLAVRRHAVPALLAGTGLLAFLRLVVQALSGEAKFFLGLATVAVAVGVLCVAAALLAGRRGGGGSVAFAIAVGAAASVGSQLVLGTWDAYWRPGLLGWAVSVAVVIAMVGLALAAAREAGTAAVYPVRRVWALGPVLALLWVVLANPAFATSQAGLPQVVAGPVQGLGLLLAAWVVVRGVSVPAAVAAIAVPLLMWLTFVLGGRFPYDGALVLLAIIGAQIASMVALARALEPKPDAKPADGTLPVGLAGAASLVGLGVVLPTMVYTVSYEIPLGFPNELAFVAAAAVLGLAGLRRSALRRRQGTAPVGVLMAGSAALVVVGAVIAGIGALTTRPDVAGEDAGTRKVLEWNIHYAVDPAGELDPEAIVRTIERHDPDVVVVNEISYGWVLGGGMDVGTWLSQRLDRPLVFAPAADRQFGVGVLSRWPMRDVQVHRLPKGDGSQDRSAVSAQAYVGGEPIEVVSVQLQNKADMADTRVAQVQALLGDIEIVEGAPSIVAGDLNANPGANAVGVFTDAGWVSAVDSVGDPSALTYPATDPEQRLDWVFGRGVTFEEARVLDDVTDADHLPVLVTLAP